MRSGICRGYKDDHFVVCNHCVHVTVCYIFPLPESGFDREKREKGKHHNLADFYMRNRREMKYKNAWMPFFWKNCPFQKGFE
jgi:hypothetical protein